MWRVRRKMAGGRTRLFAFGGLHTGTGVGGGIITNGQILHGVSNGAGEMGHVTILPDGPLQLRQLRLCGGFGLVRRCAHCREALGKKSGFLNF